MCVFRLKEKKKAFPLNIKNPGLGLVLIQKGAKIHKTFPLQNSQSLAWCSLIKMDALSLCHLLSLK